MSRFELCVIAICATIIMCSVTYIAMCLMLTV